MTASPRERLAGALAAFSNADVPKIAAAAGVSALQVANALKGRPVGASAYLRLCAACGYNPAPDLPFPRQPPSDFLFGFFGMGFFVIRGHKKHTDRQAAKIIEVAPATICRLERGDAVSIGVVLRGCAYIGLSPFAYCAVQQGALPAAKTQKVSRETSSAIPV